MKFSEAIRLGAMLKPQGFRSIAANERTCAFGAAYEAVGILTAFLGTKDYDRRRDLVYGAFPIIPKLPHKCFVCRAFALPDGVIVTHLNDQHRWTREQIADWIEKIEQQQAQPEIPQPASVEAS